MSFYRVENKTKNVINVYKQHYILQTPVCPHKTATPTVSPEDWLHFRDGQEDPWFTSTYLFNETIMSVY